MKKFDLSRMLEEIDRDEGREAKKDRQLSQAEIMKLLAKKKAAREQAPPQGA